MMLNATSKATTDFLQGEINNGIDSVAKDREVNKELDKNAFMTLLIEEMKNQDPLEPMTNKETMAQLASFSSLEQMEKLNSTVSAYLGGNNNNLWTQAVEFVGKNVVAETEDGFIYGEVERATVNDGEIWFLVGQREVSINDIVEVNNIEIKPGEEDNPDDEDKTDDEDNKEEE